MCRVTRKSAERTEGDGAPDGPPVSEPDPASELPPITGRVKWFDATRGFGFIVSDELDGDVLLHFSVLREHGRRSVPEGALIEVRAGAARARACRRKQVMSIDLTRPCLRRPRRPFRRANGPTARRLPRRPESSSRWRSNGSIASRAMASSIAAASRRTCSCTWRRSRVADLGELQPGQQLEARIAPSAKGLTAVELREPR